MISQNKLLHAPEKEDQSVVQHGDGYVLERSLSFVTEIADILQRILKQRDREIASRLVYSLTNKSLGIEVFRLYSKSLTDCGNISSIKEK